MLDTSEFFRTVVGDSVKYDGDIWIVTKIVPEESMFEAVTHDKTKYLNGYWRN